MGVGEERISERVLRRGTNLGHAGNCVCQCVCECVSVCVECVTVSVCVECVCVWSV